MAMTRVISYSELDTAKQCPHKHQLSYVERWTTQQDTMSALSKGTAWHAVLEEHYRALQHGRRQGWGKQDIQTHIAGRVAPLLAEMPDELATLIEWMYTGYTEMWGLDPEWDILAVEHNAACRLPTPTGGRSSFVLKMKIDLVVREKRTNLIRIVDHKSGKDLPHRKSLQFDDQFGLYTWGLHQLGREVFAQTWNAARTLKTKAPQTLDSRFSREPMYRTDEELTQIAIDAYLMARATYRNLADAKKMGVDVQRHTTSAGTCDWRCDYTDPCLLGRKAGPEAERDYLRAKGYTQDFSRH